MLFKKNYDKSLNSEAKLVQFMDNDESRITCGSVHNLDNCNTILNAIGIFNGVQKFCPFYLLAAVYRIRGLDPSNDFTPHILVIGKICH